MGRSRWVVCAALAVGVTLFQTAPSVRAQDAVTTGTAGGERGGRGRAGGMLFKAAQEVSGLTPEQKSKLEKLQADYGKKMQDLRAKSEASGAGAAGERGRGGWGNPEMMKLMGEARKDVESVLTEEQKKEFASKLPARRPRGGDHGTSGTETR